MDRQAIGADGEAGAENEDTMGGCIEAGDEDGLNIGDPKIRFFPFHGFDGSATSINPNNAQAKCICVRYKDSNVEDHT